MTTPFKKDAGTVVHAPHPPLTEYYKREEDRRSWVGEQFDKTASDYDRIENILGLGTGSSYRRKILQFAGLKTGMRVLDVGILERPLCLQLAELAATRQRDGKSQQDRQRCDPPESPQHCVPLTFRATRGIKWPETASSESIQTARMDADRQGGAPPPAGGGSAQAGSV